MGIPEWSELENLAQSYLTSLQEGGSPGRTVNGFPMHVEACCWEGYDAMRINHDTLLIWKQGVPESWIDCGEMDRFLRGGCWACLLIDTDESSARVLAGGHTPFPFEAGKGRVVKVFTSWQKAVLCGLRYEAERLRKMSLS